MNSLNVHWKHLYFMANIGLVNRAEYCKPEQQKRCFVNRRWTAWILVTWPIEYGDQTQEAYSSNGLT